MTARTFERRSHSARKCMWLSLISIASLRPKRWLAPPPRRTASFSRVRSKGVVLRVHTIRAWVPAIASASARVAVATPDIRQRKSTRCARRPGPAGAAADMGDRVAAGDAGAVGAPALDMQSGINELEGEECRVEPGDHPGLTRRDDRLDLGLLRHDRIGRDVAGAPQIFQQRGADDRLDQDAHHFPRH